MLQNMPAAKPGGKPKSEGEDKFKERMNQSCERLVAPRQNSGQIHPSPAQAGLKRDRACRAFLRTGLCSGAPAWPLPRPRRRPPSSGHFANSSLSPCAFPFFFFWCSRQVSLRSLGCPESHSVGQAGLKLRDAPLSTGISHFTISIFTSPLSTLTTELWVNRDTSACNRLLPFGGDRWIHCPGSVPLGRFSFPNLRAAAFNITVFAPQTNTG